MANAVVGVKGLFGGTSRAALESALAEPSRIRVSPRCASRSSGARLGGLDDLGHLEAKYAKLRFV